MKFVPMWVLFCGSLLAQDTVAMQDLSDPSRARISGVVLDERAQPAAGVTVQARPPGPIQGVLPHTETDGNGRFALAGLLPGHTYVSAFNEKAFFPDADFGPWDRQGVIEIELPASEEVSHIVFRLEPVGRLEIEARDAVTGALIEHPDVIWEVVGAPNRIFGGHSMDNSWLAPTAPIQVCVVAEGYRATYLGRSSSFMSSAPITLKPRQVFIATFFLQPVAGESICFPKQGQ
jgi:hypothetical protein